MFLLLLYDHILVVVYFTSTYILALSVRGEGYSRSAPCTLNVISTFLLQSVSTINKVCKFVFYP